MKRTVIWLLAAAVAIVVIGVVIRTSQRGGESKSAPGAGGLTSRKVGGSGKGKNADLTVRLVTCPWAAFAPFYIADKKGFFKEEFEKVGVGRGYTIGEFWGGPEMNQVLARGDTDIGYCSDTPATIAIANGLDVRIFAGDYYPQEVTGILVRDDSLIRSVADLKGKKISLFEGTTLHQYLISALRQAGLKLSDVEVVSQFPGPEAIAALKKGDVDAWVTIAPPLFTLPKEGFRVVTTAKQAGAHNGGSVLYATTKFYKEHPDVVKAFLRAFERAVRWQREHPDEARAIASKHTQETGDTLKLYYGLYDFTLLSPDTLVKHLTRNAKELKDGEVIDNLPDLDKYIDTSLLKELPSDTKYRSDDHWSD